VSDPFEPPFPGANEDIPDFAKPPRGLHAQGFDFVSYREPRPRELFWEYLLAAVWKAGPIRGLRRRYKRVILRFRGRPGGPPAAGKAAPVPVLIKGGDNLVQFPVQPPPPDLEKEGQDG
jgi:hypothetical protein